MNLMPSGLVDSHLHLQDEVFASCREAILERAENADVRRLVVNGAEERDWPLVLELARRYPQVVPCFGLHPWYVSRRSRDWLEKLEFFLNEIPSGVGEIGLDRWQEDRDEPAQEEAFCAQWDLGRRLRRPVMVHCLGAWGWMLQVLKDEKPMPDGLMFHAFNGASDLVPTLTAMGAYFSFAGNVLDERKTRMRQALEVIPASRLLLESDAPDLPPPPPFRLFTRSTPEGKLINEPANLQTIYQGVAGLRRQSQADLAESLWKNSNDLLTTICR